MNQELQHTLSGLAQKLGVSVENLWPVMVANERLSWFAILGVVIVLTLASLFLTRKAKVLGVERGFEITDNFWSLAAGVAWVVLVICLIILVANIGSLVYPEAAVIRELISSGRH